MQKVTCRVEANIIAAPVVYQALVHVHAAGAGAGLAESLLNRKIYFL